MKYVDRKQYFQKYYQKNKAKKYKYFIEYLLKRFGTTNLWKIPRYAKRKKEYAKNYWLAYRTNFPERILATRKLNQKIISGKIKRSPCVVCGATYRIHGHHPDYSKPLKVIWLCPVHHKKYHKTLWTMHITSAKNSCERSSTKS